ncbi:hypothetical protein [uncultured Duncaniella sp.]|uniref:hypothetical protein n=2 Tax=uncultured Duncaniella sp. TaxID=2768039 RepID=UPI002675FEEC|nr:hypothetical protein [uncultured Duncaniella sp.]MCI9173297.1 hypothetical protein [Muribaculaceae bacterium]
MALPSTIDACKLDLFSSREELVTKYQPVMVARIIRIREAYNWMLANPDAKDRQVIDIIMSRNPGISKSSAYSDLSILKTLLPELSKNSRDFHRWRYTEMIMETYQLAKRRKDTRTMERAATSYAKHTRVDLEDEMAMPYDQIVVQPFVPTMDVTILGLKRIPNAFDYIDKLSKELLADNPDIIDVEAEEADLQEDKFFSPLTDKHDDEDD